MKGMKKIVVLLKTVFRILFGLFFIAMVFITATSSYANDLLHKINNAAKMPIAIQSINTIKDNLNAQTKLLTKITHNKIKILNTFNSGVKGLTGFVIQSNTSLAKPIIIYVNRTADYAVLGPIIDKDGKNITYKNIIKYISPLIIQKAYYDLNTTFSFLDGADTAPHKLTILIDPNCVYCHQLYMQLAPFVKKNNLAVKWIIMGFLKPTSLGKAAAILSSNDPAKALMMDETKFDLQNEAGGIHPAGKISEKIKQKLSKNLAYLEEHRFVGTPVIIFKSSGKVKIIPGFIQGKQLQQLVQQADNKF